MIALADNTGKLIEKVNYSAYGAPTFIYDHVAPQVDQVRVADGKALIRFSEAVDQTSAKSAIKIKQGTNDLAGTITFAEYDKLAVFAPGSALPNALLTIAITTDLEDKNSNKLAAEFSQGFTYAGSDLMVYDRVAPEVEKITLLSRKFYVTFSEELDPTSIANTIGLTYTTGTINGPSTLENAKTILFTPGNSLSNNTEYTVVVKSSIKDLSGKSLTQFFEKFTYIVSDLLIYKKLDPTEHTESFVKNTSLFQGRTLDPETGLYYFRARYLQPELGRFLQGDPMGFKDSMNLYQSFGNNPVNFSDPMGEAVIPKLSFLEKFNKWVNKKVEDFLMPYQYSIKPEERIAAFAISSILKRPEKTEEMLEEAAMCVIGGFEVEPIRVYPLRNKKGIIQWHDQAGKFAKPPSKDYMVSFMGKNAQIYYDKTNATVGAKGGTVWVSPLEDIAYVSNRAGVVTASGHSPGPLSSYLKGDPIYGIAIPTKDLKLRISNLSDAGINRHWRPGSFTGVEYKGNWIANDVREFVLKGGNKMPVGSIFFEFNANGSWKIIRRW